MLTLHQVYALAVNMQQQGLRYKDAEKVLIETQRDLIENKVLSRTCETVRRVFDSPKEGE